MGRLEFFQRLRIAGQFGGGLDRGGARARLDHLGERFLLKIGLSFDAGNNIGHQIGTPLVLVEHFAPGRLGLLVQCLEAVVAAARQGQRCGNSDKQQKQAVFHGEAPAKG